MPLRLDRYRYHACCEAVGILDLDGPQRGIAGDPALEFEWLAGRGAGRNDVPGGQDVVCPLDRALAIQVVDLGDDRCARRFVQLHGDGSREERGSIVE